MDKVINKFLKRSFVCMIMVCAVVFTCLTIFMSKKTEKSITNVTETYMSEMNRQVQQKFSSIINLRLEQVEGIIKSIPPETNGYSDTLLEELIASGKVRNFTYLGFYKADGSVETIYGEELEITNATDNIEALHNSGNLVTQAVNEEGEKFLILGKSAAYQMEDGNTSIALIAGATMEYLNEVLFLETDKALAYSHIIDSDGSFVIRNGDAFRESYFQRIREAFDELDGKNAEEYIGELQDAINNGRDYSTIILVNGEQRHIYCSPLSENSNWYLISVMPDGVLYDSITSLETLRIITIIGSSAIILLTTSIIFGLYYRMSQRQMVELDRAKKEAVHANRAKSEFLSHMSHDIRTPMNAIVGMTEIALNNIQDTMRVEDCLKKVKLSSKHLLGLINDVLDMSKIESGKMSLNISLISLRETMDDIVNIMQPQVKAKNQYFDIFIQKIESEEIYCDSVRLNQILLNILSNAVKFTPEEGRIYVYLNQEPSPQGDTYVRTHFRIKDTGIGMSEEFQKKIFDSFVRENSEQIQNITGTGLGMAITKFIVDLMGGTIEIQSELEKGSEFHVTLDFKKPEVKEEAMILPPWKVLVVDDNEQLCQGAVSNLKELGVCAEWTLDGRTAVEMIEKHHSNQDDYNFVLIDWKMPDMDGMQTIHEIQKRVGKEIPVILISAYDWSDIKEEADEVQIKGFISKPLFKSTLYLCLSQYGQEKNKVLEKKKKKEMDFTGKQILVAEDIDMNWEIINELLTSVGIKLERASNGQVCVQKFEQSESGFYDAILMDIRMPVMNGYEAAKTIRSMNRPDKDLPIIAMTADAFSDDVQRCLESGMNAHTAKPLNIKELFRLLEKYLS